MLAHDGKTGVRLGKKAFALARKVGDREIEIHALSNVGTSRLITGDLGGIPEIERSLALAKEHGFGEHAGRAYTNLSTSLSSGRVLARAFEIFDEGIAYCDEHDLDAWRIYMLGWRAMAELHAGRLDDAAATASYTIARATAPVSRVHPLVALGRVRARRGEADAWAPLDEALAIALPTGETQRIGITRIGRAETAWLAGDDARAIEEAEAGLAVAAQVRDHWMGGELVMYAILAGKRPKVPAWIAKPFAQLARGHRAAAARTWAELGCPYEQALVAPDEEAALRTAFTTLERLGMPAAAAVMARRLRALGVRKVPRGRRASTRANMAGLTAREVQVLDLLAEGLRNAEIGKRLFISAKTVDHHVSAILAKLELPHRAAAARWRQARERSPEV
jgi:DNA-binding CsgD family transcriptional regulator